MSETSPKTSWTLLSQYFGMEIYIGIEFHRRERPHGNDAIRRPLPQQDGFDGRESRRPHGELPNTGKLRTILQRLVDLRRHPLDHLRHASGFRRTMSAVEMTREV